MFRSRLEAGWAQTFDTLRIAWEYEETSLIVAGERYCPDFYLPDMRVFAEVKGPHDDRIHKTEALARELAIVGPGKESEDTQTVVVLRVSNPEGHADWHDASGAATSAVVLAYCGACCSIGFTDLSGRHACRVCGQACRPGAWDLLYTPASWNSEHGEGIYNPLPFVRFRPPQFGGAA